MNLLCLKREPYTVARTLQFRQVADSIPLGCRQYSARLRTVFRQVADSIPLVCGQYSAGLRTVFHQVVDNIPLGCGKYSARLRTVFCQVVDKEENGGIKNVQLPETQGRIVILLIVLNAAFFANFQKKLFFPPKLSGKKKIFMNMKTIYKIGKHKTLQFC